MRANKGGKPIHLKAMSLDVGAGIADPSVTLPVLNQNELRRAGSKEKIVKKKKKVNKIP